MAAEKLNRSPEGFFEVIGHHIPYEVRMMRQTYVMLADGGTCLWFSQTVVNALIESFSIHARSLIEFFSGDSQPNDTTAAAKHFAKPDYEPSPDHGLSRDLNGKLNSQIAHPSYSRTSGAHGKLSASDRSDLMKFIESEVERFSKELKETYLSHWPADMNATQVEAPTSVRVSGPAGATGQIGFIGPTSTTSQVGPTGPVQSGATMFTCKTGD